MAIRAKHLIPIALAVFIYGLTNHREESKTAETMYVAVEGAIGPESFAFDHHGEGPYTGLSDGRIVRWQPDQRRWVNFAVTSPTREGCGGPHDHHLTEHICGRPLGLCFDQATGDLFVADAYMGLVKVGPEGGVASKVAAQEQGLPLGLTNGLDIDQSSGAVYFTDSSSVHQRRNYVHAIISGDRTGRVMKYEPETKQVTLLLDKLAFPNGVVLSKDGDYLLVAETAACRILKYWLKTAKAGEREVFAELPGFPDNIKRSPRKGFWVAIHSRKHRISDWIISRPWLGKSLVGLPVDVMKVYSFLAKYGGGGFAVRLSEEGEVMETMMEKRMSVSEVEERDDGSLWIGSVDSAFAGLKVAQKAESELGRTGR